MIAALAALSMATAVSLTMGAYMKHRLSVASTYERINQYKDLRRFIRASMDCDKTNDTKPGGGSSCPPGQRIGIKRANDDDIIIKEAIPGDPPYTKFGRYCLKAKCWGPPANMDRISVQAQRSAACNESGQWRELFYDTNMNLGDEDAYPLECP